MILKIGLKKNKFWIFNLRIIMNKILNFKKIIKSNKKKIEDFQIKFKNCKI